jgi:3-hydroxybutyryl-CoA dehydrogenase
MSELPIRRIGIVGAGIMGRGVAQIAAESGLSVILADIKPDAAADAKEFCRSLIGRKVAKGQIDADAAARTLARITPIDLTIDGYAPLIECEVVIEAVAENVGVKGEVLKALEAVVADTCVIATNTSSLSVTTLAALARCPSRVAGYHFFNPVPLMKIVEVIGGVRTDEVVLDLLDRLARHLGHRPVRATDTPGFLVNHAGRGFGVEALRILQERVCTAADIDRIMVDAAGFRMGAFEVFDLVGFDVSKAVMEGIYHQYYEEPRYRPSFVATQRVTAGLLGRKNGEGFYLYPTNAPMQRPPEQPVPAFDVHATRIWISLNDPDAGAALRGVLTDAGLDLETGPTPSPDAAIVLTPLGIDCTTAALTEGLDPQRCVAVDCLFGLAGRRTLMTNPATRPEIADAVHAALAHGGYAVTRIADSCGFVAQRIAAMIVNTGCEIAQQGVALPTDIDVAVELGLGYPRGPLKLGTDLGARRILAILDALCDTHRDPSYRASVWLRRRANLGLPLTA